MLHVGTVDADAEIKVSAARLLGHGARLRLGGPAEPRRQRRGQAGAEQVGRRHAIGGGQLYAGRP
ncbi:MAG: hypothetical protein Q7U26_02575, partial [Aquabacterium sp.]|nr:hypothetical protein [Aquabacterium sp.]